MHPQWPESFVVLEGQYTFVRGSETIVASAGQVVIVPAGVAHRYTVSCEGEMASVKNLVEPAVGTFSSTNISKSTRRTRWVCGSSRGKLIPFRTPFRPLRLGSLRPFLAVRDGKQSVFDEGDQGIGRSGLWQGAGSKQRPRVWFHRVWHTTS